MPETVELYGVAWEVFEDGYMHTVGRGGYSFDPADGGTLRYAFGDQIADCSEDRAAMIVALLTRPDAQFELVEKWVDDA